MLTGLLRLLGYLPLSILHAAGTALGWLAYLSSPTYAGRLRDNLLQSGVFANERDYQRILNANISETGKAFAEVVAIWFRPHVEVASWVRAVNGWDEVDAARKAGRGLIILAPHLGCFEMIAQYLAIKFPFTVLYRPPNFEALEPAMLQGRARPQLRAASTDVGGVRTLLKALRRGEAVGILPDQVPGAGEGERADFFGRPAQTMTLASKLAESTGATMLLTHTRRLPRAAGYELTFEPMPDRLPGETAARHLNRGLEGVIRRLPEQYLWSYNRYK
jgi:KDO2-lipid IV(A) lauroyltransferase